MSEEKKDMIQISVSLRKDKHEFIKAWADERDDKVANICRGWIYTGLADLREALGLVRPEPQMEVALPETHTQDDPTDDNPSVEQPSLH